MEDQELAKVKRIAAKLYRNYFPEGTRNSLTTVADFEGYGMIGLLKAKDDYDESKGSLLTYAGYRIAGEIIDQMRGKFTIVKITPYRRKQVKKLNEAKADLEASGSPVNLETLSKKLNWSADIILSVEICDTRIHSIDNDEASPQLPAQAETAEDRLLDKELPQIIQACLEAISDSKKRLALELRYLEGKTLAQAAGILNCANQSVENWAQDGKKLMKTCLEKNGWKTIPGFGRN